MIQMILVTLTIGTSWVVSMLYAPFVERKFSIMVQDLKCVTVCAMVCGILTVYLDDPESYVPIYAMSISIGIVILSLIVKLVVMTAGRPFVRKYQALRARRRGDEEAPLLSAGGSKARDVIQQEAAE